jgi:transaldolase
LYNTGPGLNPNQYILFEKRLRGSELSLGKETLTLERMSRSEFKAVQLWLDSIDLKLISRVQSLGILYGVTTNPSILSKSEGSILKLIEQLLTIQPGPITVQAIAAEGVDIVRQGRRIAELSDRIIIKIPITASGLEAIHHLSQEGIATMATAVFQAQQYWLAAMAGAAYVATYVSRLEKAGQDPWAELQQMQAMIGQYHFRTKVLAASLNSLDQVRRCTQIGIAAVTLKDAIAQALLHPPDLTTQAITQFQQDWQHLAPELKPDFLG